MVPLFGILSQAILSSSTNRPWSLAASVAPLRAYLLSTLVLVVFALGVLQLACNSLHLVFVLVHLEGGARQQGMVTRFH